MLKDGKDLAVLSIGPIGHAAQTAIQKIESEGKATIAHFDMRFLKPIDTKLLDNIGERFDKIITLEDGTINGGLGSAVIEYYSDNNLHPRVLRMGINDRFVEHGSTSELYNMLGLDAYGIEAQIRQLLNI